MTHPLPTGTKVRITDPHSHYYGQTAWIEGDNQFEVDHAIPPFVPPFYYHYYVETLDGQDIEHGYAEPSGLEVLK